MGTIEISAFLTHLAIERRVAASTQKPDAQCSEEFIKGLETRLERRLRPAQRGRKKRHGLAEGQGDGSTNESEWDGWA